MHFELLLPLLATSLGVCLGTYCVNRSHGVCQPGCPEFFISKDGCKSCKCNRVLPSQIADGDVITSSVASLNTERGAASSGNVVMRWELTRNQFGVHEIPYYIENSIGSAQVITAFVEAVRDFYTESCIQFRPKRADDEYYIRIFDGRGCYSHIGRHPYQPNEMSLSPKCGKKGVILHLLMHTLGFFHEHNRPDRDDHVTIHWENIKDNKKLFFKKLRKFEVDYLDSAYDMDSIMHFGGFAFSSNNLPTITDNSDGSPVVAQTEELSEQDILQVNKMYKCNGAVGGNTVIQPLEPTKEVFCTNKDHLCKEALDENEDACSELPWVGRKCFDCGHCV